MKKFLLIVCVLLLICNVCFAQNTARVTLAGGGTYITQEGSILTVNATPSFTGINLSPVVITGSSPFTVLAANTGRVHVITDLGQNTVIDLPPEAAGLFYRFIYADEAVETHDHTIDSEAAANFFIGGIGFGDTDAGDVADEIHLGIYSDGNSNSILTLNNLATGTWIEFHCDGTNWYLNGDIRSDTIPTLTDQP